MNALISAYYRRKLERSHAIQKLQETLNEKVVPSEEPTLLGKGVVFKCDPQVVCLILQSGFLTLDHSKVFMHATAILKGHSKNTPLLKMVSSESYMGHSRKDFFAFTTSQHRLQYAHSQALLNVEGNPFVLAFKMQNARMPQGGYVMGMSYHSITDELILVPLCNVLQIVHFVHDAVITEKNLRYQPYYWLNTTAEEKFHGMA